MTNTRQQGHTPGPWRNARIYNGSAATHLLWIIDTPRGDIKIDFGFGRSNTEQESNARLIAAAPELLEACKLAMKCLAKAEAEGIFDKSVMPLIGAKTLVMLNAAVQAAEGKG